MLESTPNKKKKESGRNKMPMKTASSTALSAAFEHLLRSSAYKAMAPTQKLEAMLEFKSFEELLNEGWILDVQGASQRSGYTPQHVRRLCREERLGCIPRGLNKEEVQFFFLPEQISSLFSNRRPRA